MSYIGRVISNTKILTAVLSDYSVDYQKSMVLEYTFKLFLLYSSLSNIYSSRRHANIRFMKY